MAILIKGMETPENCGECPFYKKVFGFPDYDRVCTVTKRGMVQDEWIRFYKERHKDCPLVEVHIRRTTPDMDKLLKEAGLE